jgi:murein DD-endopeptidase MepM/ murein hydrolase activator NlpD
LVSLIFVCGLLLKFLYLPSQGTPSDTHTAETSHSSSSSRVFEKTIEVTQGQTLTEILTNEGLTSIHAQAIVDAFKQRCDPKDLKVGQEFFLKIKQTGPEKRLLSLLTRPTIAQELRVHMDTKDTLQSTLTERKLDYVLERASGNITTSLYADTLKAGIPSRIIGELAHGLSFGVHLQRDIQQDDPYEVIYESYYDPLTKTKRAGNLVYAAVGIKGAPYEIFRYLGKDGQVGLYNAKGESVKRGLLTTPVAAVRLSSGFGRRRHPIKGYSHIHKGVDFAAARGTPVMAAGDGVVAASHRWGGYGNYIRVNHQNGYATVYAHLSKFGTGIHKGTRVRQGQIIGFVGSTGNSTGPHLHHEVLINGKHVNPQTVKMPAMIHLAGGDLKAFKAFVAKIKRQTRGLRFSGQMAEARNIKTDLIPAPEKLI